MSSTALKARVARGEHQPLFEALGSDLTGIDFASRWNPPPGYETEIATSGFASGVAAGDYDGDGRTDLFLTRPHGGSRLFRNLGGFRFQDVTDEAGLRDDRAWGRGASFADVDGDGDLDLYFCKLDQKNSLYINRGDGTFVDRAAELGVDYRGASVMIAFADYDLDGDLDAYLVTNRIHPPPAGGDPGSTRDGTRRGELDRLYRNKGDGHFVDVSVAAGLDSRNYGLSATWWDHDADGLPDIYVASDFADPDRLLRNLGDGRFEDVGPKVLPHTPWYSMGSDANDVNNDGRIDFFASDMSATTHFRKKLSMGDMDAASLMAVRRYSVQLMRNALYLNTGTERFMEVAQLAGLADSDWTWAVLLEDLDEDGWVDLFASTGMTRDFMNSDLRRMAESFEPMGEEFRSLYLDQPPLAQSNLAFRNRGELLFEASAEEWGLDHRGVSSGAVLVDLDEDGDLDLVVLNFDEVASVYRNLSADTHRITVRLEGIASNRYGIGARVTVSTESSLRSRQMTLARGFMSGSAARLHFGLGDESQIKELTVHWPSGVVQRVEALRVDRAYTLREPVPAPAALHPERSASPVLPKAKLRPRFRRSELLEGIRHEESPVDDFACQPLLPNKLSQLGPGLAWGDVDGDGDDDLYVGAGADRLGGRIYLDRGEQGFVRSTPRSFNEDHAYEDMAPLFFDADGDDDLDLYVVSGGGGCDPQAARFRDRLYLNDGRGNFSRSPSDALPDTLANGSVVTAADYDRDGDLDLFVGSRAIPGAYPRAPKSQLLRNEGGKFVDASDEVSGLAESGLVTSALWSDATGDGWLDLLVTHEWGPVKLFVNRAGQLEDQTERAGLARHSGWWNGIAASDLDHDGDIDYVVSNYGENGKYRASPEQPVVAYLGSFGDTGELRLLETEYEDGELLPGRGKSCSTRAIPSLAEDFESFREFAGASLPEVYGTRGLDQADRFEATTLESSVLINLGDGRFDLRALPRIAQAAPAYGVVLTEVDGDGNPDLYLVQNFFGTQVETGPLDGGLSLLLRGRGDGSFEAIGPERSGLVVPQDGTSLTTADLDHDGRVDFVVGVNDGDLIAFENQESEPKDILSVRLRGPAGNPTGIGARVTLHASGGPSQTAEIHAGGGYLSQSTPTLYFGVANHRGPLRLDVSWPDGVVQRRDVTADTRAVVIAHTKLR